MISLDLELLSLKENLIELHDEATNQLAKCRKAIQDNNEALAKEILQAEKRVNALELMIDKECENILALNQPVATDLRFVISALKLSNDLERIGDNVKKIAKLFIDDNKIFGENLVKKFRMQKMFDVALTMLEEMGKALKKGDTKLAKKTLSMDDILDEINAQSINVATEMIKDSPKKSFEIINMYSVITKLERIGDLTKNLGEEIIFHVDAKVIKHKKNKLKEKEI